MTNCLFESTLQKIEHDCNCTPKTYLYLKPNMEVCEGKQKKCMNKLKHNMGDYRHIVDRGETKVCLAACIDQQHKVLVTTSAYPNLHSFVSNDEFCVILDKLVFACNGDRNESLQDEYPGICDIVQQDYKKPLTVCKQRGVHRNQSTPQVILMQLQARPDNWNSYFSGDK